MAGTCYAWPSRTVISCSAAPSITFSLLELVGPTPYVGLQSGLDLTVLHGFHDYWKATHLPELHNDLIDVIAEYAFCARRRGGTWRSSI